MREVVVEYEPEDIQYMVRASPWWTIAEWYVSYPIIILLTTTPVLFILAVSGNLVLGGLLVVAATTFMAHSAWSTRQHLLATPSWPGPVCVRITPGFVESEHPDYHLRQAWTYITSVERTSGAIVLLLPMDQAIIIADRHFDSPAAAEQFYQAALAYFLAARSHSAAVELAEEGETFLPAWTQDERGSISFQNTRADWALTISQNALGTRITLSSFLATLTSWVFFNFVFLQASFGFRFLGDAYEALNPWLNVLIVTSAALAAVLVNATLLRQLREFVNRWRVPTTSLEPRQLTISPGGIVVRWRLAIQAICWRALGEVMYDSQSIYLGNTRGMTAATIPLSAFPSPEIAESFFEELRVWQAIARQAAIDEGNNKSIDAEVLHDPQASEEDEDNPYRSPNP